MPGADAFSLQWDQFGGGVAAVGALGLAAFGIVESLGKAFAFTYRLPWGTTLHHWGLPYVGLGAVRKMARPFRAALLCAYGDGAAELVAQQYQAGRGAGSAPDTIRQGVRLGLPYLGVEKATALIASVWHMDRAHAATLAVALQAPSVTRPADDPPTTDEAAAVALAGRFAAALDARINAAFQLADQRYETVAKTAAGVAAVLLALLFNWGLAAHGPTGDLSGLFPWPLAFAIGLVAVPLAPVAKDLSRSLQNALTAFKSISGKS